MEHKQTYKMIFWRHSEKKDSSFNDIAKRTYNVLQIFNNEFPEKYRPNYLTVMKKSDVNFFEWSYENFYNELINNVNHTKTQIFSELGYSLSFFSSLDNDSSCGYMIHVGAINENCLNTIAVNLSIDFDYFNKNSYELLERIFYRSAKEFGAFYACIYNSQISDGKFAKFKSDSMYNITNIHWLNYWSPEVLRQFNIKELKKIEKEYREFSFKNGFLKLQEKPLNAENQSDIDYLKKVESEIGLY